MLGVTSNFPGKRENTRKQSKVLQLKTKMVNFGLQESNSGSPECETSTRPLHHARSEVQMLLWLGVWKLIANFSRMGVFVIAKVRTAGLPLKQRNQVDSTMDGTMARGSNSRTQRSHVRDGS